LCALYEPAAGAELSRRAAAGERSLRWMLSTMRVRLLDPPDPSALASVNTPQDLERARALDLPSGKVL
jgi:molybdopterin-guanine dinucleotide biosynthesis protein A